ncbi:hypothetical protein SBA1_220005 [Candidatus Sulfotelmatobacter kueseliae]|uniref:Uncharacterized protein n=1 Tax=Candidatus Sulfotelmatobacter kueseliae TaxID=2042962 RepID=A0A2U3KH02_9BACT|nr:hypothetical protein SBA1_220005 [Candidatus Sulfotelmatobacter kueseliae]
MVNFVPNQKFRALCTTLSHRSYRRCLPIPSRPGLCILHTVDCDGRHSDSEERPLRFHVADPMWSAASLAQPVFYPDAERELLSHLSDQ